MLIEKQKNTGKKGKKLPYYLENSDTNNNNINPFLIESRMEFQREQRPSKQGGLYSLNLG